MRWQAGAHVLVLDANLSSHRVAFPPRTAVRSGCGDAGAFLALDRALVAGDRMTPPRSLTPRATYRLQFHAGFGFHDAAAIAPYLRGSASATSMPRPIFKARPGSMHGYDIVDHNELNPELGTRN